MRAMLLGSHLRATVQTVLMVYTIPSGLGRDSLLGENRCPFFEVICSLRHCVQPERGIDAGH